MRRREAGKAGERPGAATLGWLWRVAGKSRAHLVALCVLQALHGASGVLYALLLRAVIDAACGHDVTGFWRGMARVALLVAAQLALRALIRWLGELGRSTLENAFKGRLFSTLLARDYLLVEAVHSGEWQSRLTSDTVVVAEGCVEIVPGLAGMVVRLASALAMIVALEPRFAAILVPGGLLLLALTWVFRRVLKRLHKDVQAADGRLRSHLQECLGSMLMIRSFAAEGQAGRDAQALMDAHQVARMRRNRFSNLCNIGFGAAMNGMYLLGVGWCGYQILSGSISFGTLTAITQLIAQVQAPLANITGYLPRWYAMLASAERLMEAEELAAGLEGARPLREMEALYERELGALGLRDVDFAYYPALEGVGSAGKEGMPAVLHGVSLEIAKGSYVAFAGHSGCGKSTVLRLLMCVYRPDGGVRFWRDADGREHDLTGAHRRLFAYVPQGNALMSGTIREVVSLAAPEAAGDGERLDAALRIACADGFVAGLDDGVDTLLGERGAGLSEGQMQRLAIARAVFSGSPVLLLDEATSALGAATERAVLERLRALTNRTVVIVTHRPAALAICDRVIEFTEAGVIER